MPILIIKGATCRIWLPFEFLLRQSNTLHITRITAAKLATVSHLVQLAVQLVVFSLPAQEL